MKTIRRRRKENKTDYLNRLKLLKSNKPRLVFRRTNRYIISQYVTSYEAQDKVVFGVNSKDLLKYGWSESAKGSLKSITASYLTGYLAGKTILDKKLEKPIVDFGMIRTLHKTKVFAFLKGMIESGIEISCDEECFPQENRIKGEHMKNKVDVEKIKSNIDGGKK
ncbi:MAG: 50S ribosomal protein L18 [Candidatus Pacearchaeota archaeon]|nr:50S ribosomal protein L18 [Candidatus Pacearchaeota archaeon]